MQMKKSRFLLIFLIIISMLLSIGCSSQKSTQNEASVNNDKSEDEVITLKAAHYFDANHPWNKGLEFFAEKVKEDSNGRLEVKIFNNGVLGSETDMLQNLQHGTLDFVVADPSAASAFAKEMDFFALPFMFNSYEHWQKALDGEPGQNYAEIVEEKAGLKILGYWGGSSRNVLSTKKPIKSIEDLAGFKLRLVQSPLKVKVWKAVGTIPTPIAYLETYSALQAGTVDGMENESVAVRSMKFYEPAPYITRTEHEFTVRPLFMSKVVFDKLPEDLQNVIINAAQEATVYEREVEKESNIEADKEMEEKYKVQFFTIDKEPFKEATAPVLEEFAEDMGLLDLLKSIQEMES